MSIGKIVKIEFFVYLNKKLYRIVHSWEELEATEKEIFTEHPGYNVLYGSTQDFSVYINEKTKDVLTYWYRIKRTTNLKDSQGNIVCIDDELVDISNGRKCWLLSDYDGLYIRYDYWLSPTMSDKNFVAALTDVLRYFRDNGELKKAYEIQKDSLTNMANSPWAKLVIGMFTSKVQEDKVDVELPDIDALIKENTSDEFIERKINDILGIREK